MIITPHAGLPLRDLASFGRVIPTIGTMVDRMKQESLMFPVYTQVRFIEKGKEDRQSCLPVSPAGFWIYLLKYFSQPQQALCSDSCSGAINRFVIIERICGF